MSTQKKVNELIIDAQDAVVGRLASYVAKKALQGNKVTIVNSDKAMIIGNKRQILEKFLEKRKLGHGAQKGPHYPAKPEMMLRRTIRGMLPWKRSRGRETYKQIFCFVGVPEKYQGKITKLETLKKEPLNFITLGELSHLIRQK